MHTPGAQVLISVHPAAKMDTQGAPLISTTDELYESVIYIYLRELKLEQF